MGWMRRVRGLGKRERKDAELEEELRTHVEMLAADNQRGGMSERDAEENARRTFGNFSLQKERTREMDLLRWMESFWQDLRFGARNMVKNPGFTAVAILTLALGIGANTAIFSVVSSVLLRPLPYPQPERLVWVWHSMKELSEGPLSSIEFAGFRAQNTSFEKLAAIRTLNFTLTGSGLPERVRGDVVSANYFTILGVSPMLGRNFSDADDLPGASRVVLLTNEYWKTRFGEDASVVGRTLTLNGTNVVVAGVLPDFFHLDTEVKLYVNPIYGIPELFSGMGDPSKNPFPHYLSILGRLKPGVTLARAQSDFAGIMERIAKDQPEGKSKSHGVRLVPYSEVVIGDLRPTVFTLAGVVGLVLLIACANVANLLLARATAREREIAVRAALGATGMRLARQMITEGALLGTLGGLVGLGVGYAGMRGIIAAQPPRFSQIAFVQLDWRVLLFTFAIGLGTGIVFGLVPARRGARVAPGDVLKQAGRSGAGGSRQHWLRNSLVVAEVAMSLVLLVGAGLLTHSFVRLLEVKPGFNTDHLLTFSISMESAKYSGKGSEARLAGVTEVVRRFAALPGVEAAGGANDIPLLGWDTSSYARAEGPSAVSSNEKILTGMHAVTPGYFRAMGVPLLRGREFTEQDAFGGPLAVVINQAFADRFWPGQDPVGKQIHFFNGDKGKPELIVGVVGNIKHAGLNEEDTLDAYASHAQQPWPYMVIAVRTLQPETQILKSIRDTVAGFDPDMPVYEVKSLEQITAESLGSRRITLGLVGLFAVLALALATIGIYGVMSYVVAGRTQEIGVRMALGAQPRDVFRLIIGRGMLLAGVGLAVGLAAAAGLTRFLGSLLFHVGAFDPLTYAGVALLLAAVAFVACYIPARRATRVDPLTALHYE